MRKKTTWLACFTLLLASAAFASFSGWGNPTGGELRGLRPAITGLHPSGGARHRPSVQAPVESNPSRGLAITLDASGLHVSAGAAPGDLGHGPAVGLRWDHAPHAWARLGEP